MVNIFIILELALLCGMPAYLIFCIIMQIKGKSINKNIIKIKIRCTTILLLLLIIQMIPVMIFCTPIFRLIGIACTIVWAINLYLLKKIKNTKCTSRQKNKILDVIDVKLKK